MITSRTRVLGIIGDPIGHSLTPRIQNSAWKEAGIDVVNVAARVKGPDLKSAVEGARALGWLGLMVTIPHKQAVVDLCDHLDSSSARLGACNLLHFGDDGAITGYSSDGWAALTSLAEAGFAVPGHRITILGAGGSARSLAFAFCAAGAASVSLLNRSQEKAAALADEVGKETGAAIAAFPLSEASLAEALASCDLLVNTTSVGMHPHATESPVARHLLRPSLWVYDIVYNPLETALLRDAATSGARTVDGLSMLIYTNVRAAEVCAGARLSVETMRREALLALGAQD